MNNGTLAQCHLCRCCAVWMAGRQSGRDFLTSTQHNQKTDAAAAAALAMKEIWLGIICLAMKGKPGLAWAVYSVHGNQRIHGPMCRQPAAVKKSGSTSSCRFQWGLAS
jgi:hypothetical protein